MTDLSICIVSYNNRKLLEECLCSLYKNIGQLSYEIFVVDNNSNDGSVSMVREKFPSIKIIENRTNAGFARPNNQAIQQSNSSYILLLNQDTLILNSKSIETMVDFLRKNKEAGVCGCRHIKPDGTAQSSHRRFPTFKRIFLTFLHKFLFSKKYKANCKTQDFSSKCETDSISGACFLVKREIIDKVGYLDESYYFYYEETDWCYRIKKAGWKIYWLPEIEIVHYGGGGGPVTLRLDAEFWRSEHLFFKKHYGIISASCLAILYIFISGLEAMKSILACIYRFRSSKKLNKHFDTVKHNLGLLCFTIKMEL